MLDSKSSLISANYPRIGMTSTIESSTSVTLYRELDLETLLWTIRQTRNLSTTVEEPKKRKKQNKKDTSQTPKKMEKGTLSMTPNTLNWRWEKMSTGRDFVDKHAKLKPCWEGNSGKVKMCARWHVIGHCFKDRKHAVSHVKADEIPNGKLACMKKYIAKCRDSLLGSGPSSARPEKKPPDNHQRTRKKYPKSNISVTPSKVSPNQQKLPHDRPAQNNGANQLPTTKRKLVLNEYKNLVLYKCTNLVLHKCKRDTVGPIVGWETLKKTDQDCSSPEKKKRHVTVNWNHNHHTDNLLGKFSIIGSQLSDQSQEKWSIWKETR